MTKRTRSMAWLVVALLIVVGTVAARYSRAFGLLGIIASVLVAVVVVIVVLRILGPIWAIQSRPPVQPAGPRNVTPVEPSIPTGSTISPRPTTTPVVVIEPATPTSESFEARLATLDRLRDDGRLSSAEYEAKRAQLIAEI
jgi:hypothetical protein